MHWMNIHTPVLRSAKFIGSDPVARATWLYVCAYACEQENGGRIAGARAWKDRQWQQTCGVTLEEVEASTPLLIWDGHDLVVDSYPSDKEHEIKAKRESGRRGGLAKSKHEKERATSIPPSTTTSTTTGRAATEGEGEGNKKEKGKNAAEAAVLPSGLDTSTFKTHWQRYVEYRRRRKYSKLLPESVQAQWDQMAEWGEPAAVEAIKSTIANAYQGIFRPKHFTVVAQPLDVSPGLVREFAAQISNGRP